MLLTIFSVVVFLAGVSLFTALVGTSFLKKRALAHEQGPGFQEGYGGPPGPEIREHYRTPEEQKAGYQRAGAGSQDERARYKQAAEEGGYGERTSEGWAPDEWASEEAEKDYQEEYEKQYRQKVEEIRQQERKQQEAEKSKPSGPGPETTTEAAPGITRPPSRPAGAFPQAAVVKWVLVSAAVLVFLGLGYFFGTSLYQNIASRPKLYFCERVDYEDLGPVNKSDTFIRGKVTLFITSSQSLGMEQAKIDIYKITRRGYEQFASKTLPLKPSWTSFVAKVLFDELGTYTVAVSDGEDRLISQRKIYIVPDSYVFKPVPKG
ncbi:MAG: hypothetical protein ACOC7U_01170 [Spirochaetota bacterium]